MKLVVCQELIALWIKFLYVYTSFHFIVFLAFTSLMWWYITWFERSLECLHIDCVSLYHAEEKIWRWLGNLIQKLMSNEVDQLQWRGGRSEIFNNQCLHCMKEWVCENCHSGSEINVSGTFIDQRISLSLSLSLSLILHLILNQMRAHLSTVSIFDERIDICYNWRQWNF